MTAARERRRIEVAAGDIRAIEVIPLGATTRVAIYDDDAPVPLIHAELADDERRALVRALEVDR